MASLSVDDVIWLHELLNSHTPKIVFRLSGLLSLTIVSRNTVMTRKRFPHNRTNNPMCMNYVPQSLCSLSPIFASPFKPHQPRCSPNMFTSPYVPQTRSPVRMVPPHILYVHSLCNLQSCFPTPMFPKDVT